MAVHVLISSSAQLLGLFTSGVDCHEVRTVLACRGWVVEPGPAAKGRSRRDWLARVFGNVSHVISPKLCEFWTPVCRSYCCVMLFRIVLTVCLVLLLLAPELALPRTLKRCTISRRVLADTSILCQVVEYCGWEGFPRYTGYIYMPVYRWINSIQF
eukprot:COSAG01_NODE_10396_length_2176_cov_191.458835_2_plen_156_part_00